MIPEGSSGARIVVFFDINVPHYFKETIEKVADGVEVVFLKHELSREKDDVVLKHFEKEARQKHPGALAFILTHDLNFENDSGYSLSSPLSIIKIPMSTSECRILTKIALKTVVNFFKFLSSQPRPVRFIGVFKIE
ncbi:MAG: hypothetical protein AAB527_00775 [Patescibacteria group bacterium]